MTPVPMKESRKTQYTRMVLQNSLMELMKDRSIADISIKEICALADVSRSTFYAHYRNPYDLLHQIEDGIEAHYEKIKAKYDYTLDNHDMQKMIEEMLRYIHDNANSLRILLGDHGNIEFQRKIFDFSGQNNTPKHVSKKSINRETYEYHFIFAKIGSVAIIYHWLKNDIKKPISEMAKLIVDLNTLIL
jgi:AcrR family transcriptional regulator